VIYMGWVPLAITTNYLGTHAARFVQYRGIAPSSMTVWMFNVWLIVTSALEWVIAGLLLRRVMGLFHRLRQ
jgi:hypothetical protein